MTAPVRASDRDVRALARIVSEGRHDLPDGEGLPPSLIDELLGLIPSDFLTVLGIDSGRQENWFAYDFPVAGLGFTGDASPEEFWDNYWASDSCCYPDRTGDLRSVTKISDFYSARQWHSTGMYRDTIRPAGFEHQLALCLPPGPRRIAGPGQTVRLLFSRGPGLDFSERDRAVLTLLRPHLHQAYLDAERRRRGMPELTRRQWEVLRLVADGYTNAKIAHRLGVSEGTVRIHLQNIYVRLQVSSRTAAVTRAFPDLATM